MSTVSSSTRQDWIPGDEARLQEPLEPARRMVNELGTTEVHWAVKLNSAHPRRSSELTEEERYMKLADPPVNDVTGWHRTRSGPPPVEPKDPWLKSPDDVPIYSTDLVRKRHWLGPVSTRFQPASSDLTEEERYLNSWSEYP